MDAPSSPRIRPGGRHLLLTLILICLACPAAYGDEPAADPAMDLYYAANASYNRKLYPIAVGQYQDFLKQHGNHEKASQARYGLALSYFALKQSDKALPELQRLVDAKQLDKSIDRGRVVLMHAQCLINTGKDEEAIKRLSDAVKNLPEKAQRAGAAAAVIDLCYAKSQWEETIKWSGELNKLSPSAGQAIRAGYQHGMALFQLKQPEQAIKVLKPVRDMAGKAKSQDWLTRLDQLLSSCYIAADDLEQAEASLQSALPGLAGDQADDARYQLAAIKFQRGRYPEARQDYEAFIQAKKAAKQDDLRLREARFRVARCQIEAGQIKQADQSFRQLQNEDDEVAARSVLWRSRIVIRDTGRKNRYAESVGILEWAKQRSWYRNGFKTQPGQLANTIVADIDYELANALMLQSQPKWDEAAQLLRRVEQRRPNYRHLPQVLSQRAVCEHKLEKFSDSLRTNDTFLKQFADSELASDVRFHRAENLYMLRKNDEAIQAYRDFLDSDRQHRDRLAAEFRIAQIHHHDGRSEESNTLAVPLLEKAPKGDLFARLAFLVGDNYFRQAKWQEAVEPLEAFVKDFVQKPTGLQKGGKVSRATHVDDALIKLGVAYSNTQNQRQAIDCFDLLVRGYGSASPHYPLALAELGKLLYEIEEYDRARGTLTTFVNNRKDRSNKVFRDHSAQGEAGRVYYYLGWVDSAQKRYADAARHFGEAAKNAAGRKGIQGVPLEADAALQQGIALVNNKQYSDAANHLRNVAGRYKDHPHLDLVTYYTGLAYARAEDYRQAGNYFKQVAERYPDAVFADKAVYEWAWCERKQKRKDQAVQRYEHLLSKYKDSPLVIKVQSELAELNLDAGAQDKVIARLTEAIKDAQDDAQDDALKFELRYQLANAHFKKQDHEQAAPIFESLIRDAGKSPLLPSILFQAGESRLALTETIPAREHFLAASKVKKTPPELTESIRIRLGETQNMTGEHKEAAATYQGFLQSYPDSQWQRNARYGYAFALEKQKQYSKAIQEYRRLLPDGNKNQKLDKWMVQARYQIGECYFNEQQYDKAIAEFVSIDANARGYDTWRAKAVLEIGRVHLAQGKRDDAMERLKEVITRFPETTAARVAQKYLDDLRSGG
ncbi:MAG: tetratricopeptide repeat protein [Planctomycetota bacterium]